MKRAGSIGALVMLSMIATARADVAPPPPDELTCLPGATGAVPTIPADAVDGRGRPARPWPYCQPTTCASDADCTGGRVCSPAEIGLCVRDREDFGVTSREAIDRGCEPNGTCLNLQSTCERARRCITAPPAPSPSPSPPPSPSPSPSPPPAPAPASTSLCQASPLAHASLTPWLLGAFGFLLFRARRPGARARARLRSREGALVVRR